MTEQRHTLLAIVVRSARISGGLRLALAPAKFFDGQYLRIPHLPTVTYDVSSSLVQDPAGLIGAVEVTTQHSKVIDLALMSG